MVTRCKLCASSPPACVHHHALPRYDTHTHTDARSLHARTDTHTNGQPCGNLCHACSLPRGRHRQLTGGPPAQKRCIIICCWYIIGCCMTGRVVTGTLKVKLEPGP